MMMYLDPRIIEDRHFVYAGVWFGLFCCHVAYLTVFKFDYGYNMMASVVAGMYVCQCCPILCH